MNRFGWCCAVMLAGLAASAFCEDVVGIPLKPDPPLAVDGNLEDWASVPNAIVLESPGQVVWGKAAWTGPADLSGTVRIAWRTDHLFIAAAVTDSVVRQTQRGDGIWKGDHVELYLDTRPGEEPARDAFGEGQFHFAFSPGSFTHTGDPLLDSPPQAFCYTPTAGSVEGITVASARSQDGWTIEAAIPWALLGVANPVSGMPLRFELGLSDTDSDDPQQETLMTTSTAPWAHHRSRLRPAVPAGTDGVPQPMPERSAVLDAATLQLGEQQAVAFVLPPIPEGRDAVLVMLGRMDFDKVAGYTQALQPAINGASLGADRLLNKPLRVKARSGDIYSMAAGDRFSAYYSPDFTSPDNDPHYGLMDGIKPCLFEWRVTDLVKTGENSLTIRNAAAASVLNPLIVAEAAIEFRLPPPPAKTRKGPPEGPLPVIEPAAPDPQAYEVKTLNGMQLEVTVNGESFVVESQGSTPAGQWATDSNKFFSHQRRLEPQTDFLIVHDTFTNLSNENLPLMHRHTTRLGPDRLKRLWLAGLEQPSRTGSTAQPANPTTYAATEKAGIGFLALDDVFHVHAANFGVEGSAGLGDNSLVLRPGASYTAEWAVVPTATPDYWTFINAARRAVGANFTIDGGFAFLRAEPLTDVWTDQQIADFLRFKDARYACASISYPRYNGFYPHGTAFQRISTDNFKNAFTRWRKLVPEVQALVYFHCFIDVVEDGPELFATARLLGPDGVQASYGEPHDRLYVPTETNTYGAAVARNVDIIFDTIGADGVYWDEHEYSRLHYHYGEPWDGCSGNIDAASMTLTGLKSSVTLISEPWRLALARRILERGPLIGNGPPVTRAMAALKFPCFVETGSITNCTQAHLHSPIALGDHLTERSERDAYATMLAALEFGCVYHWYNDMTVIPTHPTLTRYMYPITPLELHEGYIIGEERIVTCRSGCFGWGDGSEHEVHVFDDAGVEAEGFSAPCVRRDGKTYTELRIGEGWSAAIVRRR